MLCFIKKNKKKSYFSKIKENCIINENLKLFFQYYENTWMKKKFDIFNYNDLISDIIKCKNLFINKKGDINSDKTLKSKLKNLNKFYFTNNVCESIHSKISNLLPKGNVTKNSFRDTMQYILKENIFKVKNSIRKDYITRTLIINIEKYNINDKYFFINYDLFLSELKKNYIFND